MSPSFVNSTTLLIYVENNMRLLDITSRTNIVQKASWNFTAYPTFSYFFSASAINSSAAVVCIRKTTSQTVDFLLVNLLNLVQLEILQTISVNNSNQNPSTSYANSLTHTSTATYWANDSSVFCLNYTTWKISSGNFPKPFFSIGSNGFSYAYQLTVFQIMSSTILAVNINFENVFFDISSLSNITIVDSIAATNVGKKQEKKKIT